jgi:AraC-like DNA-binding protein
MAKTAIPIHHSPRVELLTGGRFLCTPENWSNTPHFFADCHRLYFPRRGAAEVLYENEEWAIRPGRVYLFPGYRWMQHRCRQSLSVNWLHFRFADPALDLQVGALKTAQSWPLRHWRFWKPVFSHLQELVHDRPPALVLKAHAMLLWMMAEVHERGNTGENALFAGLEPLRPALQFMEDHFIENPRLDQIAAQVHLSAKHFHRRFSQSLGLTPHEYLRRRRMHLAWSLLRHRGLSVREVAEHLHCANPFCFSRAFKNFFHCAPLEVRMGRSSATP